MREIKFRAWDKKAKIMHHFDFMKPCTNPYYTGFWECTECRVCCELDDISRYDTVMQYTGLHDKNGVEIYELDKIRDSDGEVWEMFWNEKTVAFDMRKHPYGVGKYISPWCPEEFEVIGNIYENPELLEAKRWKS